MSTIFVGNQHTTDNKVRCEPRIKRIDFISLVGLLWWLLHLNFRHFTSIQESHEIGQIPMNTIRACKKISFNLREKKIMLKLSPEMRRGVYYQDQRKLSVLV